MLLKFTIPMEPKGKKEARRTRFGVHKHPETRADMLLIADAVREQYDGPPLDCPLSLLIRAYRTRPKSRPRDEWADTKPDADNIHKLITDALEGVLWVNDSRIVDTRCLKKFAPEGAPGWIEIEVSDSLVMAG